MVSMEFPDYMLHPTVLPLLACIIDCSRPVGLRFRKKYSARCLVSEQIAYILSALSVCTDYIYMCAVHT
jgi:hypothetical protein